MNDISLELLKLLTEYSKVQKVSGSCEPVEKAILRDHPDLGNLYALSVMRENLLEWVEFKPEASLLELGSGYGALTGLFAGKVKDVVVVDQNRENLAVNRLRHENCSNIRYVEGTLEDAAQVQARYDYIVLTGASEDDIKAYAASVSSHKTGVAEGEKPEDGRTSEEEQTLTELVHLVVEQTLSMLKPGGSLIFTASNRLGLKYLAGARTEQISLYQKDVKTMFAQKKGELEFYYPVPDDRFPVAVYSEDYLPSKGELPYSILTAYDYPEYTRFELEQWHDMLCEAGEFKPFANSFLIIWSSYEED